LQQPDAENELAGPDFFSGGFSTGRIISANEIQIIFSNGHEY
jgi:hypothetical protein